MKKKFGTLMILLLCVGMLTACGNEEQALNEKLQETAAEEVKPFDPANVIPADTLDEGIVVENLSPYSGIYLEGDDKDRVEEISAIRITNQSEKTILYANLTYTDGEKELTFYLEMLPVGTSVIVAEQNKQKAEKNQLTFVDGDVHYIQAGLENMESVKITPTKESTLKVKNKTNEMMPVVWIFYRKVEADGTLLGGKCYDTGIVDLGARENYEAEAEFWMDDCEIVNVLLIDSLDSLNTKDNPVQGIEEDSNSNP